MTDVHKASKILFKNVLKILIDVYNAKLSIGSMVMFRQRLTMKHFAEGLTENVSLNYFFMSSLQAFFYFLSACLLLLFFLF